jgi:hypothetical protein
MKRFITLTVATVCVVFASSAFAGNGGKGGSGQSHSSSMSSGNHSSSMTSNSHSSSSNFKLSSYCSPKSSSSSYGCYKPYCGSYCGSYCNSYCYPYSTCYTPSYSCYQPLCYQPVCTDYCYQPTCNNYCCEPAVAPLCSTYTQPSYSCYPSSYCSSYSTGCYPYFNNFHKPLCYDSYNSKWNKTPSHDMHPSQPSGMSNLSSQGNHTPIAKSNLGQGSGPKMSSMSVASHGHH